MTTRGEGQTPEESKTFAEEVRAARTNRELINELAHWREECGMTQAEVAKRMHTSQPAVARLESHQHDAQLSTLARYVTALGLSATYTLIDRETGREIWKSGEQSDTGHIAHEQSPEQVMYGLKADRSPGDGANKPPLPEIDSVLQRVSEVTEALAGALDDSFGHAVDNLIQSWVAAWIAAIETGYFERQAAIRVNYSQALHELTKTRATAQRESRELDRLRHELELASQERTKNEPAGYRAQLNQEYRNQADRVAAASTEANRAQTAVTRHASELDRENDQRLAAIAERHVLGAEAAAYTRILLANMLQDPARTQAPETAPMTPTESTPVRRPVAEPTPFPETRTVVENELAQPSFFEELLSISEDRQIQRLAAAKAGADAAEDAIQETIYQIARIPHPERINNIRAYFARVLITNANRLRALIDSPRSDLDELAEELQGRGHIPSAGDLRPADEAVIEQITVDTWLRRLRDNRDQLTVAVPSRSSDPSRYRELIVATAEALLRPASERDATDADINNALGSAYPEYFNQPGASANISGQRFHRARADVRALLKAIVSREELLP